MGMGEDPPAYSLTFGQDAESVSTLDSGKVTDPGSSEASPAGTSLGGCMYKYTCPCCKHATEMKDAGESMGHICRNCFWEEDEWEESNDPDCVGANGSTLDDYRNAWIAAGRPKNMPRWRWPKADG